MMRETQATKKTDHVPLFGTYRLMLALFVVYSHVGKFHHWCGSYAVFGFFVLSGYLMTLTLRTSYQSKKHTARDFWVNRFLRIYPVYWVAVLLAIFVAYGVKETVLWREIVRPEGMMAWVYNVIIFGPPPINPPGNHYRLISVAWSLHSELCFYVIAPFVLLRGTGYYVFLAVGALILSSFLFGDVSFGRRYFTFYGALPAFAIGSALYHWRDKLPIMPHVAGVLVFAAMIIAMCYPNDLFSRPDFGGLYTVLGLHFLSIYYLSRAGVRNAACMPFDRYMGALSYPLFLVHLPVGEVTHYVMPEGWRPYNIVYFYFTVLLSLALSAAIHQSVERAIKPYRDRVRSKR